VYRRTWRDGFLQEREQTVARNIGDPFHADAADASPTLFCRDHHDGFRLGLPTMNTLLRATDVRFIGFNPPRQLITPWPNHGSPKLVQPSPDRFISLEPKLPLETLGTDAVFSLVMSHMARNQSRRGFRVLSKIVPAVIEV
jgi:hypothetical protein